MCVTVVGMALPQITDRATWLEARRELLVAEKEQTRARDALNTRRRELPMVEVGEDYRFTGPDGEVSLPDLFGGHRQLVVNHVMFDPAWDEMCPSCSAGIREWSPGTREHLRSRDTEQIFVSRAPYAKLAA